MSDANSGDNPSAENPEHTSSSETSKDTSSTNTPGSTSSTNAPEGTSSTNSHENTSSSNTPGSTSSANASGGTSSANSHENTSPSNTSGSTSSANTSGGTDSSNIFSDINSCISTPLSTINNINSLKTALCDLPLNPCEQRFIATNITPLLSVLDLLARVSYDLSYSANILTNSPIVKPKRHKLCETIHTIYDINDQCQDIYDVIEPRVDTVLKGKC